jgi:hypothetical protein
MMVSTKANQPVRLTRSPIFKVCGGAAVVEVVWDVEDVGGAVDVVVVLDVEDGGAVDVVVLCEQAESATVTVSIMTKIKLTISVVNFALFIKTSKD